MSGTVDVLQRCYTGLELRGEVLWLNPRLPEPMRRLRLLVHYRGHTLELDMTHDRLRVSAERCAAPSMKVGLRGQIHELRATGATLASAVAGTARRRSGCQGTGSSSACRTTIRSATGPAASA
jgi:alpha,alpha-trehalase